MNLSPEKQLELLRKYEPALRFAKGESFYPMDVETYVRASSLWRDQRGKEQECIIPQGDLDLTKLVKVKTDNSETVYFLKFIEPLDVVRLLFYIGKKRFRRQGSTQFRLRTGRLSRVGLFSRLIDLFFSLSLVLRGRVPGDTSAAAKLEYEKILKEFPHPIYYGRVIREGNWIVLQYWYFYAFNNWRSGFFGANDHEADWEMVSIFGGYQPQEGFQPEWVAYSAHNFAGVELCRNWHDLNLHKLGDHVIVYVAAGSHAGYFTPGEFVSEIEMPFVLPVKRISQRLRGVWKSLLGQPQNDVYVRAATEASDFIPVPFIDYARGDGLSIGIEQNLQFEDPVLLEPVPEWVRGYKGLWGLFTRDPIAGENAPAGPMYTPDGRYRKSWFDPVGWAGLQAMLPRGERAAVIKQQKEIIRDQHFRIQKEISNIEEELTALGILTDTIKESTALQSYVQRQQDRIAELSNHLTKLREKLVISHQILEELETQSAKDLNVESSPHFSPQPATGETYKFHPILELWASLSAGLLLLGFVGLALFYRQHIVLGVVMLIIALIFVESGFRRRFSRVVNGVAIGLAIVAALILVYRFFWGTVILGALFAGLFIIWENLREFFQITP